MVLHDGETFINKEAPSMLEGLEEQIKVQLEVRNCVLSQYFVTQGEFIKRSLKVILVQFYLSPDFPLKF